MTYLRIDPDGTITEGEGLAYDAANTHFDYCSVVALSAPFFDTVHVGFIDDFGAQDQPVNPKAWALYGRSPIFGTMFVGADEGNLDPNLAPMVRDPVESWVPPHVADIVTGPVDRPDMLQQRPDQ